MVDILVVEDNKELSKLLNDFLVAEGYVVTVTDTGEKAIDIFEKYGARLIILDIMLPGMDGLAVCSKIRKLKDTTIIIVSARTEKNDKLNGLLIGADDYIEKPYDIDILLAKIKGIFKRRYSTDTIKSGEIVLDKVKKTAFKSGRKIELRAKEYELLQLFMENEGSVLATELIFNRIWGFDSESELQTVRVHVNWLREKLEEDAKNPEHILTVWGRGYRFEA